MSHITSIFTDLVRVETRLYNAVNARLRTEQDLSLGQFEFLEIIDRVPECRVLDIVGELAITVGAVSKAVDRLVAAGWCVRVAHPQDRRSSVLRLTPEGKEQLAASRTVVTSELTALTATVPPDELNRIASTLAALRATLEAGSLGQPG
ncbi:MarR family winged helix-turn-helix transcriptional regulator [Streptomyces sp. NPDC060334]|uniref:MarR family winged helix-turn-helix transcriptional regulator n=1 Tax=unclassified Streptomyces TaxID=2593676 RepID=UPI0006AE34E2|nr:MULTISPECIES: MarR family winged helix-turn-helix transcriptional regulator [unclassified Streptomyces]MCX5079104.1 MarR family winged helix-turn-helix transcriptional regulator [Streptomyces sp. NBC_00424]WUD39331.1 MarR family winged helix-turn-helix transcriptional regulator [Streptomyces sp. NBC_00513]